MGGAGIVSRPALKKHQIIPVIICASGKNLTVWIAVALPLRGTDIAVERS